MMLVSQGLEGTIVVRGCVDGAGVVPDPVDWTPVLFVIGVLGSRVVLLPFRVGVDVWVAVVWVVVVWFVVVWVVVVWVVVSEVVVWVVLWFAVWVVV